MKAYRLRYTLASLLLTLSAAARPAAATGTAVKLKPDQLAHLNTGQSVARLPGMTTLMDKFREQEGDQLVIRYADGNSGRSQAEKLRAWLVALGVPASHILLDPGSRSEESMTVEIQRHGESRL